MEIMLKDIERSLTDLLEAMYSDDRSCRISNLNETLNGVYDELIKEKNILIKVEQDLDEMIKRGTDFIKRHKHIMENIPEGVVICYEDSDVEMEEEVSDDEFDSNETNNSDKENADMRTPASYRRAFDQSPCAVALMTTPKTKGYSSQQHKSNDPLVISKVLDYELDSVPAYMKGRMKVDAINEFVDVLNKVLSQKYMYLSLPRSKLKAQEKIFNIYGKWKQQADEIEIKGYFCTDQDILLLSNCKMAKKELNIITILRHVKKLRQIRVKNVVFYIISDSS